MAGLAAAAFIPMVAIVEVASRPMHGGPRRLAAKTRRIIEDAYPPDPFMR